MYRKETNMNVGEGGNVKKTCKNSAVREGTGMGDRRKEWEKL